MKKIFLATKNKGKIKDFEKLVENTDIKVYSFLDGFDIKDVEEDGKTFEENSLKKATEICKQINMITISDDSGLCVDALNGEPGIYSARYSGENATDKLNNEKLIEKLSSEKNRKAHFVSVVSIAFPNGDSHSFRGEVEGEILYKEEGENGFGYDPLFYCYDLKKSFGLCSIEEKKLVSHRGKAFQLLKKEVLDKL